MKKIRFSITVMCLGAFLLSTTIAHPQDNAKYVMVETIQVMPVKGKEKEFEAAVKLHNETFHNTAPHQAGMNVILTGPESGWYVWYMGPTTFTDLDSRPAGAHDGDWTAKIDPLIKKYGKGEYWRYDEKLSHAPDGQPDTKYTNVWLVDLKRGSTEQFNGIMEKVKAVYVKRTDGSTLRVYSTQFNGGDGRDVAILFDFDKWADLDKDQDFKKDYEALNGENSFAAFIKEWNEITPHIMAAVWQNVFKE